MRIHVRRVVLGWLVLGWLAVLAAAGLSVAPVAGADCNNSSGTTVCSQGEIRGTDAGPPQRPIRGAYGTWCNDTGCFPSNFGFGITSAP